MPRPRPIIPPASVPEVVDDQALMLVVHGRQEVRKLREELRRREALLAEAENCVMGFLSRGAAVVSRLYNACLTRTEGNCSPKWKEEHLGHMEREHGSSRAAVEAEVRTRYPAALGVALIVTERIT